MANRYQNEQFKFEFIKLKVYVIEKFVFQNLKTYVLKNYEVYLWNSHVDLTFNPRSSFSII